MKVKVLSDLHLEFLNDPADFDPGTGDVLVLAGDICLAAQYDDYEKFFEKCVENYERVLYVMGNHEHYQGDYRQSYGILKKRLPKEIILLNNTSVLIDGVHFVGATMWTNMNNLDRGTIEEARQCMNDYHAVTNFTPEDSIDSHLFTRQWFESCIPMLRGPVFMITHHAPSPQSVKGRYEDSVGMYSTDMSKFIKANPNIKYWAHGHIHHNNDYMIGDCRVVSNPRGYSGYEVNPMFNPDFEIEVSPEDYPVQV